MNRVSRPKMLERTLNRFNVLKAKLQIIYGGRNITWETLITFIEKHFDEMIVKEMKKLR